MSIEAAKAALDAYLDEHPEPPLATLMQALTHPYTSAELSEVIFHGLAMSKTLMLTDEQHLRRLTRIAEIDL